MFPVGTAGQTGRILSPSGLTCGADRGCPNRMLCEAGLTYGADRVRPGAAGLTKNQEAPLFRSGLLLFHFNSTIETILRVL